MYVRGRGSAMTIVVVALVKVGRQLGIDIGHQLWFV